jgi:hypothetical protein
LAGPPPRCARPAGLARGVRLAADAGAAGMTLRQIGHFSVTVPWRQKVGTVGSLEPAHGASGGGARCAAADAA